MAAKKQATKTPKKTIAKIVKQVNAIQKPIIEDRLINDQPVADSVVVAPVVDESIAEYILKLISKLEADKSSMHVITIANGKVHLERRSQFDPFFTGKSSLIDALKAMEKHDLEV